MTEFVDYATRVTADPETLHRLTGLFDEAADSRDIAAAALAAGLTAPDDRDGWTIVGAYPPDGDEAILHWVHPGDRASYPSD